jgi:methyl-accepting chemotaxis protein
LNNVRESYRILLNNAVKRICAEYKAYYEDLLSGKTDRHDLIIKNLKERVSELESINEEQEENIVTLKKKVQALEAERNATGTEEPVFRTPSPATPPPPPGISEEEAEELQNTIDQLRDEVMQTRLNLGQVESANAKLTQQVKELSKSLEDEQRRVKQLRKDLDVTKSKAKAEKENAEKMAKQHLKALEKEMEDKMSKMKEDVRMV